MIIIEGNEFAAYWKQHGKPAEDGAALAAAGEIIAAVRAEGDSAVRRFAARFDKSSPEALEVPREKITEAVAELDSANPALAKALRFSANNIRRFADQQRGQLKNFEYETAPGVFAGQRVIAVERAGIYVPGGRYPLVSSALMCLIPAFCAGVREVCLASPPGEDGLPDSRILAAAGIAAQLCERDFRVFAVGGSQAVAAMALGTQSVPRCDVVAGPGNKFVAAAKRLLFGEAGIDFIAGPSDILVIMDEGASPELAAADMLAQAEHDADARARALVPNRAMAERLKAALEERLQNKQFAEQPRETARASLDSGGLIVVYENPVQVWKIANAIAPEHLELLVADPIAWLPGFVNYGSLFAGAASAEVLGDYSAGLNHTLPTSGTARFTAGLSVRHFLKTATTLRCENRAGYAEALAAAETLARAEGLDFHAESARVRRVSNQRTEQKKNETAEENAHERI